MPKRIVSEDEFIRLCNEELRTHDLFKEGMEIVPYPKGKSGAEMSGYDWQGPENRRGVLSDVVRRVKEKYEVRPTPIKPK